MGQTNILTKEAFEQDKTLKSKFGSYENYTTSFQQGGVPEDKTSAVPQSSETPTNSSTGYTMGDVVSVAETGSLPTVAPKSAYDMYMEEAENIYNQGVETNNKTAANQAAAAGAQYREVTRNVGEINKANGTADTGYAGDTFIDAYNAYRNSVNKSYSDANSANNELYSYYLSEMTKMQQAKDNKEATDRQLEQTDRQLDMQEQQYEDEKAVQTLDNIEGLKGEKPYDSYGFITSETAERIWKYVQDVHGENVPDSVMASLNSEKGFVEWLKEYNSQDSDEQNQSSYDLRYEILGIEDSDNWAGEYKSIKEKLESLKGTIPEEKYAEFESQLEQYSPTANNAEWTINGLEYTKGTDEIDISINGQTYNLIVQKGVGDARPLIQELNKLATGDPLKAPKSNDYENSANSINHAGKLVVHNGIMYIYTKASWRPLIARDPISLQNCINAYLKNAKSRK